MSTTESSPALSSITFQTGPLAGQTFRITNPITTIGRHSNNDIAIPSDLAISRQQALLVWKHGAWHIEKNPGANALLVNQHEVEETVLHTGDVVSLGPNTTFSFVMEAEAAAPELETLLDAATRAAPPESVPNIFDAPTQRSSLPAEPPAPPLAAPEHLVFGPEPYADGPMEPRASRTLLVSAEMLSAPSLKISFGNAGARKIFPLLKETVSIGRDPSNDIVINNNAVSRFHFQITRQRNTFTLVHPHSSQPRTTNGLLYQGRKIPGEEPFQKTLVNGDLFRIGDQQGELITFAFDDGSGTAVEAMPAMQPIRLGAAEITIGRKPDNTVVLAHPMISAHHARLAREGGTYRLLDLDSTNHTYVNGQAITNHLLKMGDEIRIGPYRLIYESTHLTPYDDSNNIRVEALNLKKVAANQTTLLNNISLSIPPRTFVALVGGSGAGKTTLLDALSGLRPAQHGQVLYNGQDYYQNQAAFNTQIGYVPQDDIVHKDLTVERALYYAARLRLPGDFTEAQIWQRIAEVLEDVELTERRKLYIKKLSGGQRKRVSIALELLANPSLFFLDEPTSGLDPDLDRKMMVLLRKLADKGHTIILVTHATNNINVCDYVCFLAQGGRLAFFGPPEEAAAYFGKSDFPEIYSILTATEENPNIPAEAEARFKTSGDYQTHVAQPLKERAAFNASKPLEARPIKRSRPGKLFKQLGILAQRNLELLKNNRAALFLMLAQAPIIALALMTLIRFEIGGGVFEPNNVVLCQSQIITAAGPVGIASKTGTVSCDQIVTFLNTDPNGIQYAHANGGANAALQNFIIQGQGINAQRTLFLIAFVAILIGILNAIREIVKEGPIYRRERTVNLGIVPYLLSKVLVLGSLAIVESAVLILIVNAFEPLHQGVFLPVLLETYITLALSALAGMMVGLLVSALAPNEDTANNLIPFVLIPQIIFAGAEIPLRDWVTTVLALFFPTRWTMAGLGSSLGLHGDKLGGDRLLGDDLAYHGTLFSTYSHSDAMNRILLAWIALALIIIVFGTATGIALKLKDRQR
ncbi:MAG TPA: FHA domain-containing protein [Ktedonobacterales bacterium]|nr:FHA domain-containing protein [Ktedonobacterales bacterium]